jgi:hypothetical protein
VLLFFGEDGLGVLALMSFRRIGQAHPRDAKGRNECQPAFDNRGVELGIHIGFSLIELISAEVR